jgi:hypothetical protein
LTHFLQKKKKKKNRGYNKSLHLTIIKDSYSQWSMINMCNKNTAPRDSAKTNDESAKLTQLHILCDRLRGLGLCLLFTGFLQLKPYQLDGKYNSSSKSFDISLTFVRSTIGKNIYIYFGEFLIAGVRWEWVRVFAAFIAKLFFSCTHFVKKLHCLICICIYIVSIIYALTDDWR